MTIHKPQDSSPLALFLLVSLGIHIIGLTIFSFVSPKPLDEERLQITIALSNPQLAQTTTPPPTIPTPTQIPQTAPIVPKAQKKSPPKEVPTTPPKKIQPIVEKRIIPKPAPIIEKEIISKPAPIVEKKVVDPATVDPIKKIEPPKPLPITEPIKAPKTPTKEELKREQSQKISKELDALLNKKNTPNTSADFLSDAAWSGSPRKTLSFPNITASIPQQYRSRGYGFSVTAKITFSPQGWVSSVDLMRSSGDPRIDGVFRTELRKIRIEPSSKNSYDTITKTFNVSVQ